MTNDTWLYKRNSKPQGKSWEKWAEIWWKWCYSEPHAASPASDTTGILCCKNQIYPETWFLAGTFGGAARRVCEMPSKRSIFFPIVNDLISFAEYPQLLTEYDLCKYARKDLDTTTLLNVSIDGVELSSLHNYRARSEIFEINLPLPSAYGKVVKTRAVTDGYWLFFKPLPSGEHKLIFHGEKRAYDELKSARQKSKFTVKVQYNLNVV